ncbi:unnamed protein product [Closterium sp. NIES-53]
MVQYRPPSARASRFSQRAQWGLHLGIERNYNAWKIFDVHSKETVAARDVIFYEQLTLPTYLANLAEDRDPTGGFRGDRAFASAPDKADWDEHNVDNASEEAGPLPYCSVPIPMDDENPRESVNAETYFDLADTGYVTPAEVNTNEAERIGPNFIPDPETGDEAAYPADTTLHRYTQSGLQILGLVTAVHGTETPKEPATVQQALGGEHRKKWHEAMDKELEALKERNTWKVVPIGVARNKTILTGKWVFRVKTKADGTIDKFKARWVVLGFDQEHRRDFTKTFAPVSRHTSLRILLAIAAMKKRKLRQIDVANAFLYAPVDAEIYVKLPHGSHGEPNQVCYVTQRQSPSLLASHISPALSHKPRRTSRAVRSTAMASALSSCAAALSSLRTRVPALLSPVKLAPTLEAARVAVPLRAASSAAGASSPVKVAGVAHVRAASGVAAPVEAPAAAASDVAPLMRPYLAALLRSYLARNPTSQKGVRIVQEADGGRPVVQDHLAFRTFGVLHYSLQVDGCGIESLAKVFMDFGYVRRDTLTFPAKKLRAFWFAPPEHSLAIDETDEGGVGLRQLPRVFISELEVEKISSAAQVGVRERVPRVAASFGCCLPLVRHKSRSRVDRASLHPCTRNSRSRSHIHYLCLALPPHLPSAASHRPSSPLRDSLMRHRRPSRPSTGGDSQVHVNVRSPAGASGGRVQRDGRAAVGHADLHRLPDARLVRHLPPPRSLLSPSLTRACPHPLLIASRCESSLERSSSPFRFPIPSPFPSPVPTLAFFLPSASSFPPFLPTFPPPSPPRALPRPPSSSRARVSLPDSESEYAAWTLVNAYSLNHTTISVHSTQPHVFQQPPGAPGFAIDALNDFLQRKGLTLNSDGSILKGTGEGEGWRERGWGKRGGVASPDGMLLQSSSVADTRPFHFADGVTLSVPSSYLEFAERLVLPEHKHLPAAEVQEQHRREGFEVGNADKIFESTSSHQLAGRQ